MGSKKDTDFADAKMKEIDEITRVLGEKNSDSLMDLENKTQACFASAIEDIERGRPFRAWEQKEEAEQALIEVLLLWNEFLLKKENE